MSLAVAGLPAALWNPQVRLQLIPELGSLLGSMKIWALPFSASLPRQERGMMGSMFILPLTSELTNFCMHMSLGGSKVEMFMIFKSLRTHRRQEDFWALEGCLARLACCPQPSPPYSASSCQDPGTQTSPHSKTSKLTPVQHLISLRGEWISKCHLLQATMTYTNRGSAF